MKTEGQKEKKNKQIALLTSLAIHASLFIILFFLVAWRPPNPPLNLPGVEINLGFDDQGGGDVQPDEPVRTEESTQEENTPQEEQPSEEVKDTSTPPEAVTSNEESPVVVKEQKKEPVIEKPQEKVAEAKPVEEKKEPTKEPKPNPATQVPVANKGTKVPSHGDDPGKTGDKGNPEGKPDAKALYGKPGGGGGGDGFALAMSGWAWAEAPRTPELTDNEDGKIEFEIECDENGDITNIVTRQRGLSPTAERLLKDEIRRNSLIPTSGGKKPERSKGKVVFILKTK